MNFQTHIEAEIDTDNVSWTFATIQASKGQLIKVFGQPIESDGRVQNQWIIKFSDGTVATIYDYRLREIHMDDNITWNIGADRSDSAGQSVSLVHNAFRQGMGLTFRSKAA